jgi:hypothetical protein
VVDLLHTANTAENTGHEDDIGKRYDEIDGSPVMQSP